jgi:hypothetical protein
VQSYKKISSAPNKYLFFDTEIIVNQDNTNENEKIKFP